MNEKERTREVECDRLAMLDDQLKEQQVIQMSNPPTSQAWLAASAQIKALVIEMRGSAPRDAWGRK